MKVKSRRQIELEQKMLARRPIKKLTHQQLAECIIECSKFYGWHTVSNLLTWFRSKKKDSLGGYTRTVPVKSRVGKVGHSIRELKNYYKVPHKERGQLDSRMDMLLQVPYDDLRWVANNLGKSHAEQRYGTPQFKYGQRAFGNVSDDRNPPDDIPAPTIGSPRNKRKVRQIVPPNKRQIKAWIKQSKKARRAMRNKPARDVVKRKIPQASNKPIKWIAHVQRVTDSIGKTIDAMD